MNHRRPNIETVREKFAKDWYHYDIEEKPWQGELGFPTMSEQFTDSCNPLLQLDIMSVWNDEMVDGTHFNLYKMCRHKVDVWLDQDYTRFKDSTNPKISSSIFDELNWNQSYDVEVARPRIVIAESLAGELITLLQGEVWLEHSYSSVDKFYYMMGWVDVQHRAVFNTPKPFVLP